MSVSNQNKSNNLINPNDLKIIDTDSQDMKILEFKIKTYLREEFERYIYIVGSNYAREFYSIKRKKELFEDMTNRLFKNIFNDMTNKLNEDSIYENAIIEIYNKTYYEILKDVETEQIYNEEYEFYKACEEVQQKPKEEKSVDTVLAVIKVILLIIFLPIVFCVALIVGACKHNKKGF